MSKGDHPGFFAYVPFAGTWPGALGDLIASATNVYAGSWMEAAGPSQVELEVIGWFKDWLGLPGRSGRAPRQRRLGGEPHGARVCARDAGRLDVRRPGRLRLRSGAFVGGASRPQPRLPAEPGSRDPDGRRARDARRPAPVGDGGRRRGESQAALRLRERRCHEQRRRRPAGRSRRRSAPSRTSGCTWTRRTAGSRCSTSAGADSSPVSRARTRSRSTRTSGSTSRTSAAACSSATAPSCETRS